MTDLNKFTQDMARFQGETIAGLTHISETLDKIEEDLNKIEEERKSHSKDFWSRMDAVVNSLHIETKERIEGDNRLEVCLKVVKDRQNSADRRAGLIAGLIGGIVGGILIAIKLVSEWLSGK
ncbi:MAG: hypothetical protein DDT19_01819 [Syntrophomonadaceae bacterium]|nr:hypothetical protein [Bacillota bacterium]